MLVVFVMSMVFVAANCVVRTGSAEIEEKNVRMVRRRSRRLVNIVVVEKMFGVNLVCMLCFSCW